MRRLRPASRPSGAPAATAAYDARGSPARRLEPLNRERLARLDALEADGAPSVEAIVEAFIGPVLRLGRDHSLTLRRRRARRL